MKIIYVKDLYGYNVREFEFVQQLSDTQTLGKFGDDFSVIDNRDILDDEMVDLNKKLVNAEKLKLKYTRKAEEMRKLSEELLYKIMK